MKSIIKLRNKNLLIINLYNYNTTSTRMINLNSAKSVVQININFIEITQTFKINIIFESYIKTTPGKEIFNIHVKSR